MPKGMQGFQKGHPVFKGAEKGWFKKGHMPWCNGTKIDKDKYPNTGFQEGHPDYLSSETRKRVGEKQKGKGNPMYGKKPGHKKRVYYKGICMRSTWEVNIAKWLDKQGWPWEYENKRFILKNRTYCPDFYLPSKNIYWELKGWFCEEDQETIKQFRELYPKEHLIVITEFIYKMITEVQLCHLE
ncbi:hypothetical protein LCGC14_0399400 [marine sediment metagenome]|uniref:Nuclease associated modular domain-containing protein n=1 Tax=marine sediment metagenome TaxID=412755 RepID=A0A0F9T343_9ZZZZ